MKSEIENSTTLLHDLLIRVRIFPAIDNVANPCRFSCDVARVSACHTCVSGISCHSCPIEMNPGDTQRFSRTFIYTYIGIYICMYVWIGASELICLWWKSKVGYTILSSTSLLYYSGVSWHACPSRSLRTTMTSISSIGPLSWGQR